MPPTPTTTATPAATPTATRTATPAPPNLVRRISEGWAAPLVVSEQKGGFLDFPPVETGQLYTDREVFAHWAIANDSSTGVAQAFTVVVLVDDQQAVR